MAQAQDEGPQVLLRETETARRVPTMWVGAVTSSTATVKAKLPPDTRARLYVREFGGAPQPVSVDPAMVAGSTVAAFRLRGLRPSTVYTCTLEVNGKPSYYPPALVRTFPEEGKPSRVKFAFSSCAQTGSEHLVFDTIRRREPMVFLHLGDMHYENISRPEPRLFRAAWDTVLSSPTQAALYREVPLAYIWDDHDFGPNNADGRSPSRAIARAVYREYAPHYPLGDGLGDTPIYQAFTIGRARFILTDLRSERSPGDALPVEKTMIGLSQKAWFFEELRQAARSHAVVFWASSVPWIGDRAGDQWADYAIERAEIAAFLADEKIRNLCILCGDAHMLAADDGKARGYANRPAAPIPVLHGSSLDQGGSFKGGPYSHGYYLPQHGEGCFGWVEVNDDGKRVSVDFTGRVETDEVKVALSFEVPAA
jgi:alkaline phosphatase D